MVAAIFLILWKKVPSTQEDMVDQMHDTGIIRSNKTVQSHLVWSG